LACGTCAASCRLVAAARPAPTRAPRATGSGFAARIRARLFPQREILDPDARLLSPLPVRVLCDEFSVSTYVVGAAGVLPIAVFTELRDARARLRRKLALRMPLDELPVTLDGVGRLRGPPILLFTTAPCHQEQ
jgi:hypothetical protein